MIPPANDLENRVKELEKLMANRFPVTIRLKKQARRAFIVECIQDVVAEEFHLTRKYLLSERRPAAVVWPRHIAMSLSYEMSGFSTNALATMFNRKDHVIILYAVKRVRDEERYDKSRAKDVAHIRRRVLQALKDEPK